MLIKTYPKAVAALGQQIHPDVEKGTEERDNYGHTQQDDQPEDEPQRISHICSVICESMCDE